MSHFDELLTKEPYRSIFDDGSSYKITPSGIERGHVEHRKDGTSRWNSDKTISAKPFLPTAILDNQDEAVQKVEVSLWERNRWKQTVVNREVLCNSSKVSQLANMGFPVGSDNAKDVAKYFNSILAEYDEKIPRHASRSVMGWAELDGRRVFMPYTDALSFDGEDAYKHLYDSISTLGTKPSDAERTKLKQAYEERLERQRAEAEEAERKERNYLDRLELYRTVCQICDDYAPITPWDDWRPDWCTAMRLRAELKAEIEDQ